MQSNDSIFANTEDVSRLVQLFQTDGITPATGLTITDLDLTYAQEGEAVASKVDATALAAVTTAHTDNKMIELDATNKPGTHRVDWPDAAFSVDGASSSPEPRQVALTIKGAAIQAHTEIITIVRDPLRLYTGTITTVTSQTEFVLAVDDGGRVASAIDDTFNGHVVLIEDISAAPRDTSLRIATDYTGSTTALKINRAADFTVVAGDRVSILALGGIASETVTHAKAVAGTLSTTQMTTDLSEATDGHYVGRLILWTSGVLKEQARAIKTYAGSNKMLSYAAATDAPAAGDSFVIV